MEKNRCGWCLKDDLYIRYHDTEWGVPVWDDQQMFEFLVLETFQAGLSWHIILKKRENFRKAFHHFSPEKMASMGEKDILKLLQNEGIVRNKAKINGAIQNAKMFLKIAEKNRSFCEYMWQFTGGAPLVNAWETLAELPASTPLSDAMSKELKREGFAFTGTTVCYAHMQATGMVNDHLTSCFRYAETVQK